MRRSVLAVVAVFALAACQQMTTEPAATTGLPIRALVDNPPPPPIDSGSVGYEGTTSNTLFFLNLTYFMNKPGTNGWLTLVNGDGNTSDPDARVSVHNGVVSGKGNWFITVGGGILQLDLGKLDDRSSFDRDKGYHLILDGILHEDGEDRTITDINLIPGNPIRTTDGG